MNMPQQKYKIDLIIYVQKKKKNVSNAYAIVVNYPKKDLMDSSTSNGLSTSAVCMYSKI